MKSPLIWLACITLAGCTDLGNVRDQGTGDGSDAGDSGGPDGGQNSGTDADVSGSAELLSLDLQTAEVGGPYAPQNIVAVWVEDPAGAYVQTLGRWSAVRTQHLVAWNQAAAGDADVVSGATRSNHTNPLLLEWDMPAGLADGVYTVRVEIADGNSTNPDQNHQAEFSFDKNGQASEETVTGPGVPSLTLSYSGR